MFNLDIRNDNRTLLGPGIPNPAMTTPWGNPVADPWLRRAIATTVDHKQEVEQIVSGGALPLLGGAMYTPLSAAYGSWVDADIDPNGLLQAYTYNQPGGVSYVALGNKMLDDHGYTVVGGKRQKNGQFFSLDFWYRSDHIPRRDLALVVMAPLLTLAPPAGLGLTVVFKTGTSSAAKAAFMDRKEGHLYTGGWGLTLDPDHLYYLFHISNYAHPGRPNNYAYYPGDANQYTDPDDPFQYDGRGYGNDMVPYASYFANGAPALDFSDSAKTYAAGKMIWENPQNYWSWEMMIATTYARSLAGSLHSQEAIAYEACTVPVYAAASKSAFSRTYVGNEVGEEAYHGKKWKGVVNQKSFGVWGTYSLYDMHTEDNLFGTGLTTNNSMTIRWGFKQTTLSLNPIYAEWIWDWYPLNQCFDGMIGPDPYTLADAQNLATSWDLGTWVSPDYGTCTKVTFYMRHDLFWSDGVPLTASDVKFTWGGPAQTGSISNLLKATGRPPAYWFGQVLDILSIATPDPWTVIVYLDVFAYFGLHSMSGFNIVLPEHIWKPIILTGDILGAWNQPLVCSAGWMIPDSSDPTTRGYLMLVKNPLHREVSQDMFPKTKPINIWTVQTSNSTAQIGNTHWIYPKKGETGVDASVDVYMHSKYFYEDGPSKTNVYPNTVLDGTKTVELWIWNGTGCPNDNRMYVFFKTLAAAHPFEAPFCETLVEHIPLGFVPAWWWEVKVTITITSLTVNGIPINPALNPFMGMTYVYKEHMVVTSRYDIGGLLYKPCPPATAAYQAIDDLKVNVKDTYQAGKAFGSKPGYPNWDTAADVNNDFKVDVKDYYAISQNFGWKATYPLP
jgi:ABC-type transport system substrate-binding protein